MMTESEDLRRKRLRYRSTYRGNKELDYLLGSFAREHLDGLSETALATYEALLDVGDHDLYDWILGRQPVPPRYDTEVLALIKTFTNDPKPT